MTSILGYFKVSGWAFEF